MRSPSAGRPLAERMAASRRGGGRRIHGSAPPRARGRSRRGNAKLLEEVVVTGGAVATRTRLPRRGASRTRIGVSDRRAHVPRAGVLALGVLYAASAARRRSSSSRSRKNPDGTGEHREPRIRGEQFSTTAVGYSTGNVDEVARDGKRCVAEPAQPRTRSRSPPRSRAGAAGARAPRAHQRDRQRRHLRRAVAAVSSVRRRADAKRVAMRAPASAKSFENYGRSPRRRR